MHPRAAALIKALFLIVGIAILAARFLPTAPGHWHGRLGGCRSNLQQLYKLGTFHAAQHLGQWPESGDENLWVVFAKMKPPLIEADHLAILACPVLAEDPRPGETDYLAPRIPWSKLAPTDPIAADKPGNHGDDDGRYVLLKNGDVLEVFRGDPLWRRCEEVLR